MQYYGPFAAGVAWPLRPDVDLAQLARTWKPFDLPSGDLIGECLENHTLDEALRLTARMVELSQVPEIDALEARWRNDRERMLDLGVMKALSLHFRSAYDIFDFYAARAEAVFASRSEGDTAKALKAIDRMSAAVVREEEVSRELLPLAKADSLSTVRGRLDRKRPGSNGGSASWLRPRGGSPRSAPSWRAAGSTRSRRSSAPRRP